MSQHEKQWHEHNAIWATVNGDKENMHFCNKKYILHKNELVKERKIKITATSFMSCNKCYIIS